MHLDNYIPPDLVPFWGDREKSHGLANRMSKSLGYRWLSFGVDDEVQVKAKSAFRKATAVGIFGSRVIGRETEKSDYDVVLSWDGAKGARHKLKGLDVVVVPHTCDSEDTPLVTHLARYTEWADEDLFRRAAGDCYFDPSNTRNPLNVTIPKLTVVPVKKLRPPFMPKDYSPSDRLWAQRTRRELTRRSLELRGHAVPPSCIVDELWADAKTREQVRQDVAHRFGDTAYEDFLQYRYASCTQCMGVAFDRYTGDSEYTGPLASSPDDLRELVQEYLRDDPTKLEYFCSEKCRKRWEARMLLSGRDDWAVLGPYRGVIRGTETRSVY